MKRWCISRLGDWSGQGTLDSKITEYGEGAVLAMKKA